MVGPGKGDWILQYRPSVGLEDLQSKGHRLVDSWVWGSSLSCPPKISSHILYPL